MHCLIGASVCLEEPRFTSAEKHTALAAARYVDFQCFARMFVTQIKVELLIHGNSSSQEAVELTHMIKDTLHHQPLPYALVCLYISYKYIMYIICYICYRNL